MKDDVFNKIEQYLLNHKKMTLATVSPEGQAMAHTVQYASKGNTLYFFTKPKQRKVLNILNNPGVGLAVDEDYADWTKIQGVQMTGNARVLEEKKEISDSFALFMEKYPHMAAMGAEFMNHHVIVEVKPVHGKFLDNAQGFGYYEETKY
jgi:uncharacterized protein YhbP (UPF0306 family)